MNDQLLATRESLEDDHPTSNLLADEENLIYGRGVITDFGLFFIRWTADGKFEQGGQGFIHDPNCSWARDCKNKSHRLAILRWPAVLYSILEWGIAPPLNGQMVEFKAFAPKYDWSLPVVRAIREPEEIIEKEMPKLEIVGAKSEPQTKICELPEPQRNLKVFGKIDLSTIWGKK